MQLTRRAWRFSATGLVTTGIHVAIAAAIINFVMPSQIVANGVAFVLATIFSYFVNTFWSFSTRPHRKNLCRYIAVTGIGFCLTLAISGLAEMTGIDYLLGIALVTSTVPAFGFVMHSIWTYR